jgi:hypothetical protein
VTPDEDQEALDAYSRTVVSVAERLLPSVASVTHGQGNGSAVVLSADGLLVTSAHVVAGSRAGEVVFHTGPSCPTRWWAGTGSPTWRSSACRSAA